MIQWQINADIINTNGDKALVTVATSHISTTNSSNLPLAANTIFVGEWEDVKNYGVIMVNIISSHSSALDGFEISYSSDGVNIDGSDLYTIAAGNGKTFSFQPATKYFKITYTNTTQDQTYFRLQTILKPYYVKPSSHRISDMIIPDDDAELVKSVLTGRDPTGIFQNVNTTIDGVSDKSDKIKKLSKVLHVKKIKDKYQVFLDKQNKKDKDNI